MKIILSEVYNNSVQFGKSGWMDKWFLGSTPSYQPILAFQLTCPVTAVPYGLRQFGPEEIIIRVGQARQFLNHAVVSDDGKVLFIPRKNEFTYGFSVI